eukprot:Rhum_TRINITY_DN8493_c0_g1::Rhum_TRINITY_DN8493_c0_g1_i1::g.28228::m.28228
MAKRSALLTRACVYGTGGGGSFHKTFVCLLSLLSRRRRQLSSTHTKARRPKKAGNRLPNKMQRRKRAARLAHTSLLPLLVDRLVVRFQQVAERTVPRPLLRRPPRRVAHLRPQLRLRDHLRHTRHVLAGVRRGAQVARLPVLDQEGRARRVRAHHWESRRHGLQHYVAPRLRQGREEEDVAARVHVSELLLVRAPQEQRVGDHRLHLRARLPVADDDGCVPRACRLQRTDHLDVHAEVLFAHEARREEHHRARLLRLQPLLTAPPRVEHPGVHAASPQAHLRRHAVANQLVPHGVRRRQHACAAVEEGGDGQPVRSLEEVDVVVREVRVEARVVAADLRDAPPRRPPLRLRRAAVGRRAVDDVRVEGLQRLHGRSAEAVGVVVVLLAQQVAADARRLHDPPLELLDAAVGRVVGCEDQHVVALVAQVPHHAVHRQRHTVHHARVHTGRHGDAQLPRHAARLARRRRRKGGLVDPARSLEVRRQRPPRLRRVADNDEEEEHADDDGQHAAPAHVRED